MPNAVIVTSTSAAVDSSDPKVTGTTVGTKHGADVNILSGTVLADGRRELTIAFSSLDVASSGDNVIVSADATRKIKVLSYTIVTDAAVAIRWKSGATSLTGAMSFSANGGVSTPTGSPASGWLFETAVNQALVLNLSAAVGARGHLSYFLEA